MLGHQTVQCLCPSRSAESGKLATGMARADLLARLNDLVAMLKAETANLAVQTGREALEAGLTTLAIRDQIAPPTMNLASPSPECDLDYIPGKARPMAIRTALSNSFGFGGTNAAIVFRQYTG